ncbi:MAG: PD-(D/E)XK nuclease family protein [Aerococcus sp.]|nr:PD-(D/E)XK nuclease family protein [Aerococcus sp.]
MPLQLHLMTDIQRDRGPLIARIQSFLAGGGFERRVFYLVPEDRQLASEFEVLKQLNRYEGHEGYEANAMMRLQVFSIKRLAWFLGLNVTKDTVSEIGLAMLLRKLTHEHQQELALFGRESRYLSFQERLVQLFNELERGNIHADDFQALIDQERPKSSEVGHVVNEWKKMQELANIYREYEDYLTAHPLRDFTVYDRLIHYIKQEDFTNTLVILDGFERLNAYEYRVVEALLQSDCEVVASLILPNDPDGNAIEMGDTFYQTKRLREQLTLLNGGRYQLVPETTFATAPAYQRGFSAIEEWLIADQSLPLSQEANQTVAEAVTLWKSESPQVEADQVANQIYHLVSNPNQSYRYCDFHIFIRDFERYQSLLLPALQQNHIPYFVDYPQTMAKHPLARFMASLIRMDQRNWRYQDVFNVLRTGLLALNWETDNEALSYQETLDYLENIVLAHGYEGRQFWNDAVTWNTRLDARGAKQKTNAADRQMATYVHLLKNRTYQACQQLFSMWHQAENGEAAVRALYQFMEQQAVPKQIQQWASELNAAGELEEAEHQLQVWQKFVEVLDEYVRLFGQDPFDQREFAMILKSTFEQTTYRIVPPTIDSVTITSYETHPVTPTKVAFIIGLTDQTLPKQKQQTSLLTDDDRLLLNRGMSAEQFLDPSPAEQFNHEKMIAYHLFLAATDHLYVSYPYNIMGEKQTRPSSYFTHLKTQFHLPATIKAEEGDWEETEAVMERPEIVLGNWRSQLHHLVIKERQAKEKNRLLDQAWSELEEKLRHFSVSEAKPLIPAVLSSLTYQNRVHALSPALAKKLYGKTLVASVSNLELYNKDPFSYFLQYGLRLKERALFAIDQRLTGSYSHEFLQRYYDRLATHPNETTEERLHHIEQSLAKVPAYAVFQRQTQESLQQEALNRTVRQLILREAEHFEAVKLENWYNELTFGRGELELALPINDVNLTGIIDRVDAVWMQDEQTKEETLYFEVIDYKSSLRNRASELKNLGNLYDGTSLQLYTYLAVIWQAFQSGELWRKQPHTAKAHYQTLPIGIFYEELSSLATDPHLVISNEKDWQKLCSFEREKRPEMVNLGRLNGYLLESKQALTAVSQTVEAEALSSDQVYPFQLTKQGAFSNAVGYKNRFTAEQFSTVVDFVLKKIATTVQAIQSGQIPLYPVKDDPYLPSLTTFKSVARYDATDSDLPRWQPTRFDASQPIADFFEQLAQDRADETTNKEDKEASDESTDA